MSASRDKAVPGPRDSWIPWLFVGFFGVVLAANLTLAYVAISTFTGLETDGYYRKGLEYNRVIEAEHRQAALGWTVSVAFDPTAERRGRLSVRAFDGSGKPLDGATVTAQLFRPTQAGYDKDITLHPAGAGSYEAEFELPLRGQWDIRTQIAHRSDVYRTVERIVTQ